MRRFFIAEPPASETVCLRGDEAHHVRRVLRLKLGDELLLFDAAGAAYRCELTELGADSVTALIKEAYAAETAGSAVILLQAVLKSPQRMDFIVQKSTELGVTRIIPFYSTRCIPRWDGAKGALRQQHWQQIAIAAVKQSGVRRVPAIDDPGDFQSALIAADGLPGKIVLWEGERSTGLRDLLKQRQGAAGGIAFAVGPEGGFTEEEIGLARKRGFITAGLGRAILRAETAPLAVLTIIGYESGTIG